MKQRKKTGKGGRGKRHKNAHKTKTQHQQKQKALDYSNGIGPLLVGKGTEPGDLDLHFEFISEAPSKETRRAFGFRLQLTKPAMLTLIVASLLAYAAVTHNSQMFHEGIEVFKALAGSGVYAHVR